MLSKLESVKPWVETELTCHCFQPPPGHHALSWGVISAAGIFAVSVSGHSSLPALRNSMARASDFDAVLNFSFLAMLSIYGSVAGIGYYYFGDAASDLITTDLAINSPFTGHYLGKFSGRW